MIGTPLPFSVVERDVDLVLLERLHLQPDFVHRLAERVGLDQASLASGRHSVVTHRGESDLLLLLDTESGCVVLLLEDSIGPPLQPRQAERYHERDQDLIAAGEVTAYRTVLCAPAIYLASLADPGISHAPAPVADFLTAVLSRGLAQADLWRGHPRVIYAHRQPWRLRGAARSPVGGLAEPDSLLLFAATDPEHATRSGWPRTVRAWARGRALTEAPVMHEV